MAFSVVMPALEMAQETGKLVAWRKKEGQSVAKGEPLLEVETDKAVLEVESPADGILAGVKEFEGAVIPVGRTIAWIVQPGETPPLDGALPQSPCAPVELPAPVQHAAGAAHHATRATRVRVSPKARHLAKEQDIDLSRVQGTGPGGEILAADVLAAASLQRVAAVGNIEIPSSVGRLMAERTTQSWTTVPHFFVSRDIDAMPLISARERVAPTVEKENNVKVTHTDFLVAAVASVLPRQKRLNASWTSDGIRLNSEVNIAIAMAVDDGVVAAVIPQTEKLTLGEIARLRRDLTDRARAGRLRPADISGATFTISNLGMYHVSAFSAIISPPQAAILAAGSISERVVAMAGQPTVRPMFTVTLSCDHRVVDGARAALFLNDFVEALREPEKWLR